MALLALLVLAFASGTMIFALGTDAVLVALIFHGVVGFAVVLLVPWKWWIIRRGMAARQVRSTWPSVVLGVLVVVTLSTGVLHSSGLVGEYGPFDDMQVHVGAALASLVFAGWHVYARRTLPRRTDLERRNFLSAGLLAGSASVLFGSLEGLYRLAGLPGGRRRFTGSFEEGSHDPPSMPSIIWLFDPRPVIAEEDWELEVEDASGARTYSYEAISRYEDRLTATIDCTTGWYAEQEWPGVDVARLVEVPDGARSLFVRSATGYFRRFPVDDVPHLLLATGYEGRPLAFRHGFPARLVAPGRRGFWWVKWVTRLEVSDVPWGVQPPFPLQ